MTEKPGMLTIHLIGIGGAGLSAIARVLLESGYRVSGSDQHLSPQARSLQQAGVHIFIGHAPANVQDVDLVVRSSAIGDENVEVIAAKQSGVPVLKRADLLDRLMAGRLGIAVAGSHGKTTTTAMIAWMFTALGEDPTFIIGGVSTNLGSNAHAGRGRTFIIEADEYDHMFLGLHPRIAVVTNVEHDHPDFFPTPEDFQAAFLAFAGRIDRDGLLIACDDDPGARRLMADAGSMGIHCLSYGISGSGGDYLTENLSPNEWGGYDFEAAFRSESLGKVSLQVPGKHNAANGLAALAVAHQYGLSTREAGQALSLFSGTGRRFEFAGEAQKITIIDDYAHHPSEIRATLAAARVRFSGRELWVLWQPHTYSRTLALLDEFTTAFVAADHVIVTEVFAAREQSPQGGFSASQVVAQMDHPEAYFIASLDQATAFLLTRLSPGAILLVLSAGDADQVSANVLAALRERNQINV